jgi:hypothetical protein
MKFIVRFKYEQEGTFGKSENDPDYVAYEVEASSADIALDRAWDKLRYSNIPDNSEYIPAEVIYL